MAKNNAGMSTRIMAPLNVGQTEHQGRCDHGRRHRAAGSGLRAILHDEANEKATPSAEIQTTVRPATSES
jgi:hypothetical protein